MHAAQGRGSQKELATWFQRELPESKKHAGKAGYPSPGTMSRWASGEEEIPIAAFVLAIFKVLESGESVDELLGHADGLTARLARLEGRVEEQRTYIVNVAEEVNRLRADRGERPISFPQA